MTQSKQSITTSLFRDVLGLFPTGVVAVTGVGDSGQPIGMILGSFVSVSLDPPLVSFLPGKSSSSWSKLARCERYCINVLGSNQEDVCRALASKSPDKFDGIAYSESDWGNPMIVGSLAYIHCKRETVHDEGDHEIVICEVEDLAASAPGTPLLFYRGGFGTFTSQSLVNGGSALMEKVQLLDRIRDLPEALAQELGTEVSAVALVENEVVLIGSYGRSRTVDFPTRVGQYLPFIPPIGGVFASWGDGALKDAWLNNSGTDGSTERNAAMNSISNIRRRGYALGMGHNRSLAWEQAAYFRSVGDPQISAAELCRRIAATLEHYNPETLDASVDHEFHFAQAPIFDAQSQVQLALTLWGPPGKMPAEEVGKWSSKVLETALRATQRIGGVEPENTWAATSTKL